MIKIIKEGEVIDHDTVDEPQVAVFSNSFTVLYDPGIHLDAAGF